CKFVHRLQGFALLHIPRARDTSSCVVRRLKLRQVAALPAAHELTLVNYSPRLQVRFASNALRQRREGVAWRPAGGGAETPCLCALRFANFRATLTTAQHRDER